MKVEDGRWRIVDDALFSVGSIIVCECVCVRVSVRVCVRACVCVCALIRARARARSCVGAGGRGSYVA